MLAEDPDQATADLADLVAWLDRVYLRFHRAALSTCWLWHPDVVEELWWLRRAHADAFHAENGSWLRVGDWHDRQRPGVVSRVNTVLGKCSLSRHVARNGRPSDAANPTSTPLATHHGEAALAWTSGGGGLVPSEAMLAEAADLENVGQRR